MTRDEARDLTRAVLRRVAPEADLDALHGDAPLDERLGLDSFDFLTFAAGLQEDSGVNIPERDYPRLASLDSCAVYLADRTGQR